MVFDKLFYVRLGYIGLGDCPRGLYNWPRRVRAPAVARDRRKATVKKTKNRTLRSVATKGTIPLIFTSISKKAKLSKSDNKLNMLKGI